MKLRDFIKYFFMAKMKNKHLPLFYLLQPLKKYFLHKVYRKKRPKIVSQVRVLSEMLWKKDIDLLIILGYIRIRLKYLKNE